MEVAVVTLLVTAGTSMATTRLPLESVKDLKSCPYRTAAMIFTAILDLEARRKAKETSMARRRKIRRDCRIPRHD